MDWSGGKLNNSRAGERGGYNKKSALRRVAKSRTKTDPTGYEISDTQQAHRLWGSGVGRFSIFGEVASSQICPRSKSPQR